MIVAAPPIEDYDEAPAKMVRLECGRIEEDLVEQVVALAKRHNIKGGKSEIVRRTLAAAVAADTPGIPVWGPGRIAHQRDLQWAAYLRGEGPDPRTLYSNGQPIRPRKQG